MHGAGDSRHADDITKELTKPLYKSLVFFGGNTQLSLHIWCFLSLFVLSSCVTLRLQCLNKWWCFEMLKYNAGKGYYNVLLITFLLTQLHFFTKSSFNYISAASQWTLNEITSKQRWRGGKYTYDININVNILKIHIYTALLAKNL